MFIDNRAYSCTRICDCCRKAVTQDIANRPKGWISIEIVQYGDIGHKDQEKFKQLDFCDECFDKRTFITYVDIS